MLYLLCYPFVTLGSIVTTLFAICFGNFIVAALANTEGNLPSWCSWFQTFDASLDTGMLARREELAVGLGGDTWGTYNPNPTSNWEIYLNRLKWLVRNPAYGFDYYVWGIKWDPKEWKAVQYISTDTYDFFVSTGSGFNVYYQGPFGTYKLGWKSWNNFDVISKSFSSVFGDGTRIPVCFTLNPFKKKV